MNGQATVERWNGTPVPARVAERAYSNVDVSEGGCWISRYSVGSHGYAQIGWKDGRERHGVLAHRAAWTRAHGQVPLGMTLDHVCKERRCVNPEHLRMLPNHENARRTNGADWPIGYCKHGHPSSELVRRHGQRSKSGAPRSKLVCRVCSREWQRAFRKRGSVQAFEGVESDD